MQIGATIPQIKKMMLIANEPLSSVLKKKDRKYRNKGFANTIRIKS